MINTKEVMNSELSKRQKVEALTKHYVSLAEKIGKENIFAELSIQTKAYVFVDKTKAEEFKNQLEEDGWDSFYLDNMYDGYNNSDSMIQEGQEVVGMQSISVFDFRFCDDMLLEEGLYRALKSIGRVVKTD